MQISGTKITIFIVLLVILSVFVSAMTTIMVVNSLGLQQITVSPPTTSVAVTPKATTQAFTASYQGWSSFSNSCGSIYNIYGEEPSTLGKYPVFIYTHGTLGGSFAHDGEEAKFHVSEMAKRGYVAASIQYESVSSATSYGCIDAKKKAQCIYQNKVGSALSVLCSRTKADCSKGIVVSGLSQGSYLATLAKNYEPRVQAAYTYGSGAVDYAVDLKTCVLPENRSLPSDRLRVVDGEVDEFMSGGTGDPTLVRKGLEDLTGLSCGPTAYSCFGANGQGWYMVKNSEVQDGKADHCYNRVEGCGTTGPWDVGWLPPAGNQWSLKTNLDWLTRFIK